MVQLLSTVTTSVRVVGRGELPDKIPGNGPLGGILTGLELTDEPANLFLAVDLPLLERDFLRLFHSRFVASDKPLLACRIDGDYPLCLGIRRGLEADIAWRVQSGRLSIHSLIEESNADLIEEQELITLGFDRSMFANLNTPEEWKRHNETWS